METSLNLILIIVGGVGLIAVLLVPMILSIIWQRKGLSTQEDAMSHVEESLELSRRSVELQERTIALVEEMIRYQRDSLEVLRRLADREVSESVTAAGSHRPTR